LQRFVCFISFSMLTFIVRIIAWMADIGEWCRKLVLPLEYDPSMIS
jgi:hypothetical protein